MRENLKRFIVYFIIWVLFCVVFYFIIKKYDFDGNTVNWIVSNKYYLIFLFLSIIVSLLIYWKTDVRSKFLLYFIISVNVLYLLFLFLIWNIWLNNTQWLIILWLLVLWLTWVYIRNWFGYLIIWLCVLWSLMILYFSVIPLYDKWPDFEWFEEKFDETFLIYSTNDYDVDIAQLTKDSKVYNIYAWLHSYDMKIWQNWSQLIFKSDYLYSGVYCFIVFKWWDFVEILPQSALNIDQDFKIEILTWNIKYYPNISGKFSFTWGNQVSLENSENVVNIVRNRYNESLRLYVKNQMWWELFENKTILKFSKGTLNLLSKIFPWKYEDNLRNLQAYLDLFDINLDEKVKYEEMDKKWAVDNVWWGLKKGIEMVK